MAVINPNRASIIYQATTVLLDKVTTATRTRNKQNRKQLYAEVAKIRYFLKALTFYPTYIDAEKANQILQCLVVVSGIQDYPVAPVTSAPSNPVATSALQGEQGIQGPRGADGGATDFAVAGVNGNMVVDTFSVSSAYAARWDYIINGTAQRAGTVYATWTEDGAAVDYTEISTPDVNGTTIGSVSFTVTYSAGVINLNAVVSAGTWDIRGSRYFIPNQGLSVVPASTPLPSAQIFVGNSSSIATAVAVTGDIGITNTGVTSISSGVIVNADVNASAAIAVSKLAALSHNTAVVLTDGSGKIASTANGTEGQILSISGGVPAWTTIAGSGTVTSVQASGGTTGLSFSGGPITGSGTLTLSGTLGYANGGTNQTFYTQGDLIYASAANTLAKRAVGSSNQILTVSGGVPAWSSSVSATTGDFSGGIRTIGSDDYFLIKRIDIGTWDMDSTASISTAHGLTSTDIISVHVKIYPDAGTGIGYDLLSSGTVGYDTTNVLMTRTASGQFDDIGFDGASNRGEILIIYRA